MGPYPGSIGRYINRRRIVAVALNRRGAHLVFGSKTVGGFRREIILIPLLYRMLISASSALGLLLPVIPLSPQVAVDRDAGCGGNLNIDANVKTPAPQPCSAGYLFDPALSFPSLAVFPACNRVWRRRQPLPLAFRAASHSASRFSWYWRCCSNLISYSRSDSARPCGSGD